MISGSPRRRLLVLSNTFFPDPNVPAVRMTQWCRHLPNHGWTPHVLCRFYGYESSPETLATFVHPDVRMKYLDKPSSMESASESTHRIRKRFRRMIKPLLSSPGIASLFVPDPSIGFWRSRRQQVLEYVRTFQPDVILTTSPSHAIHDVGLWLAEQTGISWVADFRDPYLIDNRFRPSGLGLLRVRTHERFIEAVYKGASLITCAIPNHMYWLRWRYPFMKERLLTLTNAFPPELIDELAMVENTSCLRKTILVAGTIPEPEQLQLATAVASLVEAGNDVQLKLVGKRPNSEMKLVKILGARLIMTGYVSHKESIQEIARADVLVNFLDEFRSQSRLLSTKLFEYLATGKPVICCNPSRADRPMIRRMSGVKILRKPTLGQLVDALGQALTMELRRDPSEVGRFRQEFNWEHRVAQLASSLDKLITFPCGQSTATIP